MIDEIDSKQQKQKRDRSSRLDFLFHIQEVVGAIYKIIFTIFLGIIISISLITILLNGLYEWINSIIQLLNSLNWTAVITISLFTAVKTTHSIYVIYFKKKYKQH